MTFQDAGSERRGSVPNAGTRPDQQQQDQQQQDNNENNVDDLALIWQNPENKEDTNSGQQQQQSVTQQDAGDVIANHIQSLNLVPKISNDIAEQVMQGDASGLQDIIDTAIGNLYKQVLRDTSLIADKKIQDGVTKAVSQSSTMVNANAAVNLMHERLAFTKDPAIAPVAKVTLGRAIKAGQDVDQAIDTVKRFFNRATELSTGGKNRPPKGRPNSRPNNASQMNMDDGVDEFNDDSDWENFLTAG